MLLWLLLALHSLLHTHPAVGVVAGVGLRILRRIAVGVAVAVVEAVRPSIGKNKKVLQMTGHPAAAAAAVVVVVGLHSHRLHNLPVVAVVEAGRHSHRRIAAEAGLLHNLHHSLLAVEEEVFVVVVVVLGLHSLRLHNPPVVVVVETGLLHNHPHHKMMVMMMMVLHKHSCHHHKQMAESLRHKRQIQCSAGQGRWWSHTRRA